MQYIHTNIHVYKIQWHFFPHKCAVFFFIIWISSKQHLNCSDGKMLCLSCKFVSRKVFRPNSIYNIEISRLRKIVPCLHIFPTEIGYSINSTGTRETSQHPQQFDNFEWVKQSNSGGGLLGVCSRCFAHKTGQP